MMRKIALSLALLLAAPEARAFCGFYVGGAGADLFNNATQVALMREGTRTVLTMQNNFQGPPGDFAMVVPVPVVLRKENVKTLALGFFSRLDQLTAPRLVEYQEQNPCPRSGRDDGGYGYSFNDDPLAAGAFGPSDATIRVRPSVRVEARFEVGEYDVVILGADDSMGLEKYLIQNGYKIPPGAAPYLRPYVEAGSKFFVARVGKGRVKLDDRGMAQLSPLRFHYDDERFTLPVRLGLINSAGTQDLIVYILAKQRYEVANRDNVIPPTNLVVTAAASSAFGSFYAALFDRSASVRPGAVFTEYAWQTSTCDPCPTEPLNPGDLSALGADVLPDAATDDDEGYWRNDWVVTRLHTRYSRDALGEDLVFRQAPPLAGGSGMPSPQGRLEGSISAGKVNQFQTRFVRLLPWRGMVNCPNPIRGLWGSPSGKSAGAATGLGVTSPSTLSLASFVQADQPMQLIQLSQAGPVSLGPVPLKSRGCAGCQVEPARGIREEMLLLGMLLLAGLMRRRGSPTMR